jgi:RHS repeat-associated protein
MFQASASSGEANDTVTVQFYVNGVMQGSDSTSPYSINLSSLAAGTYTLMARAVDGQGAQIDSVTRTITVSDANAAPTVTISAPTNNANFPSAPAGFPVNATAGAGEVNGWVTRVEFYVNGNLVNTDTAGPWSFPVSGLANGTYTLTAKAFDQLDASTTSAPITVTVGPQPKMYFLHVDHLNTPRLVANDVGTTVWRWDQQEPLGNNVADENPSGLGAFDLPLRLPGQYYDRETALHYNAARNYDATIGRYEESDPIGLKGGLNTYAYAHSNPLLFSDPSGLAVWLCIRSTSFRFGNHSYFYDDKAKRCCGSPGWNADHPLQDCPDRGRGPGVDSCTLISSNDDDANRLFKCCQQKANPFTYFPIVNDCQDNTDDCIREIGMAPPQTPSTGRWMRCPTCWRR